MMEENCARSQDAARSVIRARRVCKVFKKGKGEEVPAVQDLNIDVAPKEFVAIVGPLRVREINVPDDGRGAAGENIRRAPP